MPQTVSIASAPFIAKAARLERKEHGITAPEAKLPGQGIALENQRSDAVGQARRTDSTQWEATWHEIDVI